jgi:hypothetical protein
VKTNGRRKVGPSGPVAGMADATSQVPGAPPANLAELLQRHRGSGGKDTAVAKELLDAFAYLAYRKYATAQAHGTKNADDLLGELFLDLGTCIERLAENDVAPEKVESYIKGELYHSRQHLYEKDTISLSPPASTVADRKKKGLEPLPEPVRVRTVQPTRWEADPEDPTDPLHDPACSHLVEGENHSVYVPGRFNQSPVGENVDDEDSITEEDRISLDGQDNYAFLADTLVKVAETPLERTVVGMLQTGHSGNGIADSLNVSRRQITNIINMLRTRVVERLRLKMKKPPVAKSIPWTQVPDKSRVPRVRRPLRRTSRAPIGFEDARDVAWPEYSTSA